MKYKTISVTTNHGSAELVSSAMFDVGAEGVSILDKQDFLDLVKSDVIWDYVDETILLQSDAVKVSTVVTPDDVDYEIRLEARLSEMKEYGKLALNKLYSKITVHYHMMFRGRSIQHFHDLPNTKRLKLCFKKYYTGYIHFEDEPKKKKKR